jgi:hypothetical protein
MRCRAFGLWLLLAVCTLSTAGLAQAPTTPQTIVWRTSSEYSDYLGVYNEKDMTKKAAGAEKFLVVHADADPVALTTIYKMLFLSYANDSNWAKVVETYNRMNLAPKLTDVEKEHFAKIAETARTLQR